MMNFNRKINERIEEATKKILKHKLKIDTPKMEFKRNQIRNLIQRLTGNQFSSKDAQKDKSFFSSTSGMLI
jgi:hypothetical protein